MHIFGRDLEEFERPPYYTLPEKISSMTLHHIYGTDREYMDLNDYMEKYEYVLLYDLIAQRYNPDEIVSAVTSGELKAAPWPKQKRHTDLIWHLSIEAVNNLRFLAEEAVEYCYGMKADEPIGGDIMSVGAEMGSQQRALVGLIYAREQGQLIELEDFDRGAGPLYINAKSPFAKLLGGAER